MKTLLSTFCALALASLAGCGPAAKPDFRIAVAHKAHRMADSLQHVAVANLVRLQAVQGAEALQNEVTPLLAQSTATLAQLDQLDPGPDQAGRLNELLAQEGRLLSKTTNAQAQAVKEAREQASMKALMGGQ